MTNSSIFGCCHRTKLVWLTGSQQQNVHTTSLLTGFNIPCCQHVAWHACLVIRRLCVAPADWNCGGGACQPCGGSMTCSNGGDCRSGSCSNGLCATPATCSNGVLDAREGGEEVTSPCQQTQSGPALAASSASMLAAVAATVVQQVHWQIDWYQCRSRP